MCEIGVVVGSLNAVKVNSVRNALEVLNFPLLGNDGKRGVLKVEGIPTISGVDKQPKTDEEILRGALNRARHAKELRGDAKFWVGIEGGVEEVEGEMWAYAWIIVIDEHGKVGKGQTGRFVLPEGVAKLVREGYELGEADDLYFQRVNSKQNEGAIGILSNNAISRTQLYQPAVIFAFLRWLNPLHYTENP